MKSKRIIKAIGNTEKPHDHHVVQTPLPIVSIAAQEPTLEDIEAGMSTEERERLNTLFDIFVDSVDWNSIYDN
jgi:hypothetical protein